MNENSGRSSRDEAFEALLKQLVPAPLEEEQFSALIRGTEEEIRAASTAPSMRWGRAIPLVLACLVVSIGIGLSHFVERTRHDRGQLTQSPSLPLEGRTEQPFSRPASTLSRDQVLPASADGGHAAASQVQGEDYQDLFYGRSTGWGHPLHTLPSRQNELWRRPPLPSPAIPPQPPRSP